MKHFFPYADGLAGINTQDMGKLPSGRTWIHIEEPCAPEIGKRIASTYADSPVITQWVFDGHPSGEPLMVWTANPAPNAEDGRFIKREITRLTGTKLIPENNRTAVSGAPRAPSRPESKQ